MKMQEWLLNEFIALKLRGEEMVIYLDVEVFIQYKGCGRESNAKFQYIFSLKP
jgi:hypothetical protein